MAPRNSRRHRATEQQEAQQPTAHRTGRYIGSCVPKACQPEAACVKVDDNSYNCICPHDYTFPNTDNLCPNRKVVPLSPRPFLHIIPSSKNSTDLSSTLSPHYSTTPSSALLGAKHGLLVLGCVSMVLFFGFFVACLICCLKKNQSSSCISAKEKSRKQDTATPVSLSKGLLEADRYTNNPQYFAAEAGQALSVPLIARERVHFLHVIGEGCFGKVFKGEVEFDGVVETVAIKVLKESASKEAEEDFMREVEIMSSFKHPNILSFIGIAPKEGGKSPWMVFEFMTYGDLTEVLRSNSKHFWTNNSTAPRLSKELLLRIAREIAEGMKYLAGQRFVHRDLACRNCLVGDNLAVKIADFGMSRDVYTCDYYKIGGSRLLPVRWMSPESVTYGRFTLESDVWSYGVVLWEIYSLGKQPYYGHSNEEVVKLILQGIMLIPAEECPAGVCEVMEWCWKTEPKDRATFSQICDRLDTVGRLPRPPPFPVTHSTPVSPQLDDEQYLKPTPARPPHEYLQTLPY